MILSIYIGRKFLQCFIWAFLAILTLIFLIDGSDQIASMSSQGISLSLGIRNALTRLPIHLLEALPLTIMLASLICFINLTKTNELIVTRASGRSALRILLIPICLTLLIGTLGTTLGNPLVALSIKTSEKFLEKLGLRPQSFLSVSADGIWLGITLFQFDGEDNLEKRISAVRGKIKNGTWELKHAKIWTYKSEVGSPNEFHLEKSPDVLLKTNLTQDQILNSFSDPRAINFWSIPDFINKLEISGFSATRHKLFYQNELSRPLFLVAMMMIGAAFSLRYNRFNQTGLIILLSVLVGFILFSLNRIALSLGDAQQIPILLAAHGPPLTGILITLGLLLHLEDG